jgi:hypothetical protein
MYAIFDWAGNFIRLQATLITVPPEQQIVKVVGGIAVFEVREGQFPGFYQMIVDELAFYWAGVVDRCVEELKDTAWTQANDAQLPSETKSAFANYRKELWVLIKSPKKRLEEVVFPPRPELNLY